MKAVLAAALCLTMGLPVAMAAPAAQMVEQAKASEAKARSELVNARKQILADKRSLTEKLQASYQKIAQARTTQERLEDKLRQLEVEREAWIRQQRTLGREEDRKLELIRMTAKLGPEARLSSLEKLGEEARAGIIERIADYDKMLKLTVGEQEIADRQGKPMQAQVIELGSVAALALGPDFQSTGLLNGERDGRPIVQGPLLSEEQASALQNFRKTKLGPIVVDVDGTLVQRPATEGASIGQLLAAGGAFVWPIILIGLFGLALVFERFIFLQLNRADPLRISRVIRLLVTQEIAAAKAIVQEAKTDIDRLLLTGIETLHEKRDNREASLEAALLSEEPKLERSLTMLAACAGIAPLLGLLGTVTGMISTFDVITEYGTGNPRLLSGGISVALITTQLGLIVAVPLVLAHAWASRAIERRQALLEEGRNAILAVEVSSSEPPKSSQQSEAAA
ncbi:MAG: MotA/TolQ/ExbB proton channel family protein [Myxococcota bacterium]|nr:MotA/TolQ/ExbB proton channel family protein [Myxococcota bacterium]